MSSLPPKPDAQLRGTTDLILRVMAAILQLARAAADNVREGREHHCSVSPHFHYVKVPDYNLQAYLSCRRCTYYNNCRLFIISQGYFLVLKKSDLPPIKMHNFTNHVNGLCSFLPRFRAVCDKNANAELV